LCISKTWLTLTSSPTIFSLRRSHARSDLSSLKLSVSVQVPDQESWIEGYRGTGWELEDDPNTKYQPIRAYLRSAGRVLQYFASRQRAGTTYPFKSLADKLTTRDPLQRPLLSNTDFLSHRYYQRSQMFKSQPDADAQVKEAVKRKCMCGTTSLSSRQDILEF